MLRCVGELWVGDNTVLVLPSKLPCSRGGISPPFSFNRKTVTLILWSEGSLGKPGVCGSFVLKEDARTNQLLLHTAVDAVLLPLCQRLLIPAAVPNNNQHQAMSARI